MQIATAVYLLLLTVCGPIADYILDGGVTGRLQQAMAHTMSGVVMGGSAVSAVVCVFLAYASYRGWGWSFWVAGGVLAWGTLSAFRNLSSLVDRTQLSLPLAGALLSELVSALGLALLCWFVASIVRYGFGSWARPKEARGRTV
jgi:hypothetical protein